MSDDLDDLLQPTVPTERIEARQNPWRVQSQFWVAFFGGILALTVIALINARRLGIDRRKRWLMTAAAVTAMGVLIAFWLREPAAVGFVKHLQTMREMRIISRVIAVVLFLVLAAFQKPAEAQYLVFSDGAHASLWKAGLAATFILGTIQNVLIAGITWIVRQ